MPDSLSETYDDLLEGSYDCVDRIVLNAYFRPGHSPGGFRTWWRQLCGSDENLDNTHLMRMAGRFSRRLRAFAQTQGIPLSIARSERGNMRSANSTCPSLRKAGPISDFGL